MPGIFFRHGESWRTLRRFAISTMRDLGVGKKTLEERILIETQAVSEEIAKSAGEPCDIAPLIQMAVTNVICSILFADR